MTPPSTPTREPKPLDKPRAPRAEPYVELESSYGAKEAYFCKPANWKLSKLSHNSIISPLHITESPLKLALHFCLPERPDAIQQSNCPLMCKPQGTLIPKKSTSGISIHVFDGS